MKCGTARRCCGTQASFYRGAAAEHREGAQKNADLATGLDQRAAEYEEIVSRFDANGTP